MTDLKARVARATASVLPDVVRFRRERHAHPELTWQEHETAKAVEAELRKIPGLSVKTGIGRHGLVALLEGDLPGPTVALRADMDALPVEEKTGVPYTSCKPGVMHACGHDGHMATLLGAAHVLAGLRGELRGRVKLIFQPAEEGGRGGEEMCKDGALEAPNVDAIFALHGWPELPCGTVGFRSGPIMASTTDLKITVRGRGCHAAMPHLGTDQVLIAARIIEALQMVSSRHVAPTEPVALSITKMHGGTAVNVIPSSVELGGTLRTLSVATRDNCMAKIKTIVTGIASMHGAEAEVLFAPNYPPTVNDENATSFVEAVALAVLPEGAARRMGAASMGGEDFAFFLEKVPGSYFFLGVDDGRAGGYPSLHHPGYDFNEAALPTGIQMFAHLALAAADRY